MNALDRQIFEAKIQLYQAYSDKTTDKNSEGYKVPLRMKTVALTWLMAHQQHGLTARELFNDHLSLQKFAGRKLSQRVEAYSMCLRRPDKEYVTKVKQGKEWRYSITDEGFTETLRFLELAKIKENSRKMEEESRKSAFRSYLKTKITALNMQRMQLLIEKFPQILNKDAFKYYSMLGKSLVEAVEAIQLLQTSASNPDDRPTRDSAVILGEIACSELLQVLKLAFFHICLKCSSSPL